MRHLADGHVMTSAGYRDGSYDGAVWDLDADKMSLTNYRLGIKEGPAFGWHDNGRIAHAGNYHNDKPDGEFVE